MPFSSRSIVLSFAFVLSALAMGCTVRGSTDGDTGGGGGGDTGGGGLDGGFNFEAGPVNPCSPGCGPTELCGDGDGDGLDDNCDGRVDEGCTCEPGTSRVCFAGPPDRRDIGACADGVEYCSEFGIYEGCSNGTSPSAESCDGVDNDCNGTTDDGLAGCSSAIMCPGNEVAAPLSNHTLRGDRVYTGTAMEWHWNIECPDSVPAELCPRLSSPTAENTDVYLTASGGYRVSVEVVLADGTRQNCAWTVYVRGGGLRVELNWDTLPSTSGATDMDLHLHQWTSNTAESAWFDDNDDCYYANCTPGDLGVDWPGHPDSELSNCADAPHGGGAEWSARGGCANPRLDIDTNGGVTCDSSVTDPQDTDFCAPENINVDVPVIGQPYRILVNDYSNSGHNGTTFNTVSIYCGGNLRGSFGRDTEFLDFSTDDGAGIFGGEENASWIVADVVFFEAECGLDCRVYPILRKVRGEAFAGLDFGPPWSCTYDAASHSCTPR